MLSNSFKVDVSIRCKEWLTLQHGLCSVWIHHPSTQQVSSTQEVWCSNASEMYRSEPPNWKQTCTRSPTLGFAEHADTLYFTWISLRPHSKATLKLRYTGDSQARLHCRSLSTIGTSPSHWRKYIFSMENSLYCFRLNWLQLIVFVCAHTVIDSWWQ